MSESDSMLNIDRVKYEDIMGENLPTLRAKLNMNQTQVADKIGVSRQTISMIERKVQRMSWSVFLSLLFLFSQTPETRDLLPVLGIYTPELEKFFSFTNLDKLR